MNGYGVKKTITIEYADGLHKVVLEPMGDFTWVTFYELMGYMRWVALGTKEEWDNVVASEEFGIEL